MAQKQMLPLIKIEDVIPSDEESKKCAPNLEFENGSCIPLNILIEMAEAYNEWKKDNKIIIYNYMDVVQSEYKKYLLYEFKKRFDNDHKKWINEKFIELMSEESKDLLENKTFRPEGPQGKFEWLSTLDINKVLYQYEDKYPGFKFLGAVPIDFKKFQPFKSLDFKEMEDENIKKFGIIFNLDPSWKSGSHWVSLYVNLENAQIYFADSYGTKPPKEVDEFIKEIINYFKNKSVSEIDNRYNKTQHQRKNSECGVYSINFILRLLKGKTFDHITKKRLPDDKVNKCRIIYFNNTNN